MIDLNPIFTAVRQAAALCQAVQRHHLIRSEKGENDPVTLADYGSQAILCRVLQRCFPDDAVMSEESGRQFQALVSPEQRATIVELINRTLGINASETDVTGWLDHGKGHETARLWVIDPVDGTKGFLAQRHYVIAVGWMLDRQPAGAVIGAPAYPSGGRLFYAQQGEAFAQPLDGTAAPHRIFVSNRVDVAALRAVESVEKSHASLEQMAQVRRVMGMNESLVKKSDSQEKYARIAAGDAELYLRLPRIYSTRPHSIWDHAPGVALLRAAGGTATDVDGAPLDFSDGTTLNNRGVIATNGHIHAQIVEAVQQVLALPSDSAE